jgi:hypothetical protein
MRWFKHMTATRDDEKIVALIADGGIEAYGFYWAIIELVARQMEKESEKCSVTYPLPYLSRQLYLHHNKVSNLLGKLQVTGLILLSKVEVDRGVSFTITCPNLLKYRDEYSNRRAKNRDKIGTKSGQTPEQDTDTDTDTDINSLPFSDPLPKVPNKKADAGALNYSEDFERFWVEYPKRECKKGALKKFQQVVKSGEATIDQLIAGAKAYRKKVAGQNPKYTKQPTTWLNNGCWNDEAAEAIPENKTWRSEFDPLTPPANEWKPEF